MDLADSYMRFLVVIKTSVQENNRHCKYYTMNLQCNDMRYDIKHKYTLTESYMVPLEIIRLHYHIISNAHKILF